jgi:hypothetical protein
VSRPEGYEEQSKSAFATLKDCTEDAKAHGYSVWNSKSRRQGETLADSLTRRWSNFGKT